MCRTQCLTSIAVLQANASSEECTGATQAERQQHWEVDRVNNAAAAPHCCCCPSLLLLLPLIAAPHCF